MINYSTMTELASKSIRENILAGIYPPGTSLIPAKLEKEMKLGRVAIREALRELHGTGLVVSVPNKGTTVSAPPTLEEVGLLFEVRYILEGKAAYRSAYGINTEQLERLKELHKKMVSNSCSLQEFFSFNRELHLTIYQASGLAYICRLISQLMDQVMNFRSRHSYDGFDLKGFNEDHLLLIEALQARSAEEAKRVMIAHLHRSAEQILGPIINLKSETSPNYAT